MKLGKIDKFLICTLVIGMIFNYMCSTTLVKGDSMLGNFHNNDYLIAQKNNKKDVKNFKRGDVVLVDVGPKIYIKRIVGLPNETISISKNKVTINDEILQEDYLDRGWNYEMDDVKIGENEFFIMGDNRDNSNDSRMIGSVPINTVKGKIMVRVFPFNKMQKF